MVFRIAILPCYSACLQIKNIDIWIQSKLVLVNSNQMHAKNWNKRHNDQNNNSQQQQQQQKAHFDWVERSQQDFPNSEKIKFQNHWTQAMQIEWIACWWIMVTKPPSSLMLNATHMTYVYVVCIAKYSSLNIGRYGFFFYCHHLSYQFNFVSNAHRAQLREFKYSMSLRYLLLSGTKFIYDIFFN